MINNIFDKFLQMILKIIPVVLLCVPIVVDGQNIRDYKKCLKITDAEDAALCLVSTGNALGEQGKYREAEEAFREALKISPKDWITANAYSSLGLSLGRQGKYSEAITSLENAVRLNPDLEDAWYDLGVAYFKANSPDKAIQSFKQAILIAKFDWIIDNCYLNLAYVYFQKNDFPSTKRNYEILLKRNPELAGKLRSEIGNQELWKKIWESTR